MKNKNYKTRNVTDKQMSSELIGRKIKWNTGYSGGSNLKGNIIALQMGDKGLEALVEVTDNSATKEMTRRHPMGKVCTVLLGQNRIGNASVCFVR